MHDDSNHELIGMYLIKWLLNVAARETYSINMQLNVIGLNVIGLFQEISFTCIVFYLH